MDEIKLVEDMATIKANAKHTRETLDKLVCKIDTLVDAQASNTLYRKLTWLNLSGMLAAVGFNLWPRS